MQHLMTKPASILAISALKSYRILLLPRYNNQWTKKVFIVYAAQHSLGQLRFVRNYRSMILETYCKSFSTKTLLSQNTVASYIGNMKPQLLELCPGLAAISGRRLQNIASILDKPCAKRSTDFAQQRLH
ncbi:hypothetical protein PHMEG_00028336 [Phytophthora megakarya]|uniref:Uncharacterized protein n=1 Tax=Phytophthora megakarya TaxID=4795 RepID=A0A225V6T4_9STRA|nr:hypothetical protein PHMEG_00028336 [Phytophthora megakarya]